MKPIILFLVSITLSLHLNAEEAGNAKHFEKYSVFYTVFNSTFIQPDVAKTYGIKRSKYESLINISVVQKGQYGGLPVKISGSVTDLMQQQKTLEFKEIKENNAVYYLAPVRITGEDIVHFEISTQPEGEKSPLVTTFTKKIYAD